MGKQIAKMSVLSKQERCFIVRSWALVSPDLESHGYQFFIMLFKDEPSLYAKHFSNFDINDIERIRTHGLKVMRGVNSMVEAVSEENDESLIDQIHFVAHGHHLRGVTARNEFEVVCNNLEKYLA